MSNQVLSEDIAALNFMYLSLIARHSAREDDLALRLNIPTEFRNAVASMSMNDMKKVADMGTCLIQPLVDSQTILNAAKLTPEQGHAHLRSASRIKQGLTR